MSCQLSKFSVFPFQVPQNIAGQEYLALALLEIFHATLHQKVRLLLLAGAQQFKDCPPFRRVAKPLDLDNRRLIPAEVVDRHLLPP